VPILVAVLVPAPAVPPAQTAQLPKTGSQLPLVGLLGLLSLAASLGLKLARSIG
jgi:LPXTG-motif cell wall-anchored protein